MKSQSSVINRRAGKFVSVAAAAAIAVAFGASSQALAASDGITVSGSIAPTITLALPTRTIAYGSLTPNNIGGAPGAGVSASTDTLGTTYTYTTSGKVEVQSNAAWSGTVSGTITAPSLTDSDFSLIDDGAAPQPFGSQLSFGTTAKGASSYQHNYGVRVDWTDTTGDFSATITYSVTNG